MAFFEVLIGDLLVHFLMAKWTRRLPWHWAGAGVWSNVTEGDLKNILLLEEATQKANPIKTAGIVAYRQQEMFFHSCLQSYQKLASF
jgi:hypothetical protein